MMDQNPSRYWKQGIYAGHRDNLADALVVHDGDHRRHMTFGEFSRVCEDDQSTARRDLEPMLDILHRFHPQSRPVLWRLLIAQAHIYRALATRPAGEDRGGVSLAPIGDRKHFDWRPADSNVSAFDAVDTPFAVAERYLSAVTGVPLGTAASSADTRNSTMELPPNPS